MCVIEMKTPSEYTAEFIENKDATVFITVDVSNLEMAESLAIIDKKIRNLPEGSRVRIQCQAKHPLASDKDFMEIETKILRPSLYHESHQQQRHRRGREKHSSILWETISH